MFEGSWKWIVRPARVMCQQRIHARMWEPSTNTFRNETAVRLYIWEANVLTRLRLRAWPGAGRRGRRRRPPTAASSARGRGWRGGRTAPWAPGCCPGPGGGRRVPSHPMCVGGCAIPLHRMRGGDIRWIGHPGDPQASTRDPRGRGPSAPEGATGGPQDNPNTGDVIVQNHSALI